MRSVPALILRGALSAAILVSFTCAAAAAGATHPFSARDMVAMERLGDPQPSPDGKWVVFTRRTWNAETNETTTNLWIVAISGGEPRRLTASKGPDTGPRWSPDGETIAFLSSRSGSSQIWTIDPLGGEALQRTTFPVDVDNIQWSPDGARLAFTAEVYPDCPDLKCTASRDKEKDADPVKARTYTSLPFRHWDSWEDGKRSHIFVWPLKGGDPIDLMKRADADSPTKPFGGTEEFAWSPDGKEMAFTAKITRDAAWSTDLNIHLAATDGSGFRSVTSGNRAVDTQPAWSPDGRTLAYLAMTRPGFEADRQRVMLYDNATGQSRALTESWDRSAQSLLWSRDGRTLFVTADDTARVKIFAVPVSGGEPRVVVGEHHNSAPALAGRDRLVFTQDSLTNPAEVFTCRANGSDFRALTKVNAARVAEAEMSKPEEFWFVGAQADRVHGWILKPVGFRPGRKYPVAFLIHGGPQGTWDDHFHYRWNPQAYAGAGYVTVTIDFHGSTGYGQSFTDAIREDWGGKPYEDLMKGLDHVIATNDYVDGGRVCALGASFGGYMVNWIAGRTDRFKCLVSHDGEFDEKGSYYTTEELWFPEWEFGGTPWENKALYERFSPSEYVQNWKTPMLVIHGALDFRLPETEGFSVFTALQRRGVPSKFLYFPDENHWVQKSKNSLLWHETVLGWLDQWLGR